MLDSSYSIIGDYVVNEYVIDTSDGRDKALECRLEFQPTGLRISELAIIEVGGMIVPVLLQWIHPTQSTTKTRISYLSLCALFYLYPVISPFLSHKMLNYTSV